MAADVSSVVKILNGRREEEPNTASSSTVHITRDLLGGWPELGSEELNLDLHVPQTSENRLDLKMCDSLNSQSSSSSSVGGSSYKVFEKKPKTTTKFMGDQSSLELKLLPSCYNNNNNNNQSVCTLEKVKLALERAGKHGERRKRCSSKLSCLSQLEEEGKEEEETTVKTTSFSSGVFASGCQGCLLYVVTSKSDPRCPRCGSVVVVPSPLPIKRPRIDLNSATL